MRILQIINNLGSGGAEKLISEFVPVMRDRGVHVEVLLLQRNGSLYIDHLERAGIKVTVLSESSLYSLKHIWSIRNYIRKGKFDVVHVHIFPSLYFAGLASLLGIGKSKLVFTEHSTHNNRRGKLLYQLIDKFIYSRYQVVIGITNEVTEKVKEHLNLKNIQYTTIGNGIDLSAFCKPNTLAPSQLYCNYSKYDRIITMVGRFTEAKDQATLIRAIVKLPEYAHLLLLGEGPLRGEMEELVNSLDLGNRVHFLGFRSDIPDVLRISDIGVLSSNWEGMPLSAIEIMAAGIPFVGSRVPGIKDLVELKDDGAGILFECGNSDELAEKLNLLLSDNEHYYSVASACKARSKEYSVESMVEGYLEVYKQ